MIKLLFFILIVSANTLYADLKPDLHDKDYVDISEDSSEKDSLVYLNPSDFTYAGNPRVTLTGDMPLKKTSIRPLEFSIFTGSYLSFMVIQHVIQSNTIWKEQAEFKIYEDGHYALWSDKAGHFFGTYFTSNMMREGFLLSGVSWESSLWWSALMGLSYSTYVEIMDGYGENWGFSPSDAYMNTLGAIFFIGQHYWPYLQNFTPKFTYFPAEWHGEHSRKPSDMFIDDYSSHTLWLSVDVNNMLPRSLERYWPDWMNISVGYAARNLCDTLNPGLYNCDKSRSKHYYDGYWGSPRFIVALDYDLVQLLPEGGNFWNWIRQSLNYFKLPSPAVEFGPVTKVYLMYPFKVW
ncbi:MAG: DUF2279 domain-containing protein [Candidatus Kapaibacterium sp.]